MMISRGPSNLSKKVDVFMGNRRGVVCRSLVLEA